MIPVNLALEPPSFDAKVRQRGLSAIDEMVGRPPRLPHRGKRRKKIASSEAAIPSGEFPHYWRNALPDLLKAYDRRCAFLAMHIEQATGNPTVDHLLPKSHHWQQVYEWDNYRLCAAGINAKKRDLAGIVDPFLCKNGWFALEFVAFQVTAGPSAPASEHKKITETLKLVNTLDCLKAREEYVVSYQEGHITLAYLERRAPFIAAELRRQSLLQPGDV